MGFHPCPIEPGDWSDGPYDSDLPVCEECEGEGVVHVDSDTAHDLEGTCPKCGGSGVIDVPDEEDFY